MRDGSLPAEWERAAQSPAAAAVAARLDWRSTVMAQPTRHAHSAERDQMVFAIVLIAIGVIGVITQVWKPSADLGGWVVLVIGLGFLTAFASTRRYGYSIPGGILTGLGAGIVISQAVSWATSEGEGGAVVLGLGLGFLSILLLQRFAGEVGNGWWPLIPGGILTVVGGALLIGGQAVELLDYWGIAVVAIGVLVLWRAFTARGQAS
jgi:hypothetical protein